MIENMYKEAMRMIKTGNTENAQLIINNKDKVLERTIKMRKNHVKRVNKGDCEAELTNEFTTILHSFERIGNSCANIVDAAVANVTLKSFFREDEIKEAEEQENQK